MKGTARWIGLWLLLAAFGAPGPGLAQTSLTGGGTKTVKAGGDVMVRYLSFLVNRPLKKSDAEKIRTMVEKEMETAPGPMLQNIATVQQTWAYASSLDELQLAALRQQQIFALHQNDRAVRARFGHPSPFMQILDGYFTVQAEDTSAGLVLTTLDVDNLLDYYAFVGRLAGQSAPRLTLQQKARFYPTFAAMFHQLPVQQKVSVCSMGFLWPHFERAWKKASATQRQVLRRQLLAQANAARVSQATYPTSGQGGKGNAAPAQQGSGTITHEAMMFYQNLFVQSQVDTLNTWSALSGSGNVYQLSDY